MCVFPALLLRCSSQRNDCVVAHTLRLNFYADQSLNVTEELQEHRHLSGRLCYRNIVNSHEVSILIKKIQRNKATKTQDTKQQGTHKMRLHKNTEHKATKQQRQQSNKDTMNAKATEASRHKKEIETNDTKSQTKQEHEQTPITKMKNETIKEWCTPKNVDFN